MCVCYVCKGHMYSRGADDEQRIANLSLSLSISVYFKAEAHSGHIAHARGIVPHLRHFEEVFKQIRMKDFFADLSVACV